MIKGKWKLLICTILVTCVLFMASNSVFAAINEDYYNQNVKDYTVADTDLDSLILSDILLDALGKIIFNIGRLLEFVLGQFFILITGSDVFPWADAILFNAIPFLDINVFNPSGSSLLAVIQETISGTYYTILTLASAFFGVAVMVSAIKLVLTAIAEDKARYKKAIVDWLLGLVMLWGIHFFVSFVLYLNEELVKVASTMASQAVSGAANEIIQLADSSESNAKIVKNFITTMSDDSIVLGDVIRWGVTIIAIIVVVILVVKLAPILAAGKLGLSMIGMAVTDATSIATFFGHLGVLLPYIGAGALATLKITAAGAVAVGGAALSVEHALEISPALIVVDEQIAEAYENELDNLDDMDKVIKDLYQGVWEYEYTDANGKKQTRSGNTIDVAAALLKNSDYRNYRFPDGIKPDDSFLQWEGKADKKYIKYLYLDTMLVCR